MRQIANFFYTFVDFEEDELGGEGRELLLDEWLEAGDML